MRSLALLLVVLSVAAIAATGAAIRLRAAQALAHAHAHGPAPNPATKEESPPEELSVRPHEDFVMVTDYPSILDKNHLGRLQRGMGPAAVVRLMGRPPEIWDRFNLTWMRYLEHDRSLSIHLDRGRVAHWLVLTLGDQQREVGGRVIPSKAEIYGDAKRYADWYVWPCDQD